MESTNARKLFVAGASGATGKVLVVRAQAQRLDFVAHYRPARGAPANVQSAAVFELADAAALEQALRGCTTVLQLIGTMRNRFARGDTYETSDIGTTRQLVDAAKRAGTVDHFILLGSVGAGRPMGAYLKAKAEAERVVTQSGLPYTIFRPSMLSGGERPKAPAFVRSAMGTLGLWTYKPIELEELAAGLLESAKARAPLDTVLEGRSLWDVVATAGDR